MVAASINFVEHEFQCYGDFVCCVLQTGKMSPTRHLDPNVACLQGAVTDLKNYRLVGLIERVMLVVDVNTQVTYVIKVATIL